MNQHLTRGLWCLCTMLFLCQPGSKAEPRPTAPVTRPTAQDLKGIVFGISSVNPAPRVDSPIPLKVTIANKSDRPLILRDRRNGGNEINYLISIERVGGSDPQLTELGVELYSPRDWERVRDVRIPIEPGESMDIALDVSRIYKIQQPGEYHLQVKRYVYRAKQDLLIPLVSNQRTIRIAAK